MKCEADRRVYYAVAADHARRFGCHTTAIRRRGSGVAALAIGDPAVFVSVDAMHQGPHGGGPVIAIVELDD